MIGSANFMAYIFGYVFLGGEAVNGSFEQISAGNIFFLQSGVPVSRGLFLYSGIHSISVWPTFAAIMLAMLTLAKERIVSSMRRTIIRGRTFITVLATLITFTAIVMTVWFIFMFAERLSYPRVPPPSPPAASVTP